MFTAKNATTPTSSSPSSITNKGTNTFIQPKLNIGESGDKYEVEADKAADQIVAKSNESSTPFFPATPAIQKQTEEDVQKQDAQETEIQQQPVVDPITPGVQLKENNHLQKAEEEEIQQQEESSQGEEESVQQMPEDTLQTKETSDIAPTHPSLQKVATEDVQRMEDEEVQEKEEEEVQTLQKQTTGDEGSTSSIENNLNNSRGGGSPLDNNTKGEMESGFGADFGGVRVHNDTNAVQMNQQLGSQAFANGNDIYFNEGKYNPESDSGKHLLAHELTHTVQQGASDTKPIQKAEEETVTSTNKPTAALDISQRLSLTDEWAAYLDSEFNEGKRTFDLDVKIGESYKGTIKVNKTNRTAEGKAAKYELAKGNDRYLEISGWSFLNPLRQAGVTPILVLKSFGDEQQTTGFLSVKMGDKALVGDVQGFIKGLNENLEKMQFLGIAPINVTDGLENTFENGRLVFQISALSTVVDGFLEAGGGIGITGETFTFNLNANVDVAGLASGEFTIARSEDGKLSGTGQIQADIANVQATINVEYIEGVVTIQGTGKMNSEKFSGEITLLVTDEAKSKQMMHAALGTEALDKEKETAAKPTGPVAKAKGNQVLAGWGEIQATITPWLEGTAKVGIDSKGQVTIVGEVVVPDEVELMEQRGKKVDLFNVEIRAGYGIPLVGQVFLFANIGMFMNAGFGPLVLKNVGFTGTYSTDPDVLQNFSITGTLGINAFAIIGLEAEAGVGVTLLGHDLKAGVNVTAAAGLRAYAEATPTFEYQESKAPEGGKIGESRLKGHFEAAAQLFLQLTGSLFYELDSPWWSPAPDGREDFPLGEVQYPIGDSMGIGADIDWLVGSPDAPELTFSPVDFDPDKFTADVMADPPPKKMGKADEEKQGDWKPEGGDGKEKDPKVTGDGKGLPENNKKKEDLKKLPDEQKYMRALDEMSKLEKANPKPVVSVVDAKAKKVRSKYGLDKVELRDKQDDTVSVYVKHAKEDNSKHLLKVPLMSLAEAVKLRSDAITDLRVQEKKVLGEDSTITESAAKEMIKTWLKAHPIVETANVVDGAATWDYFIDFGDKSNTEKGKAKKIENNDGAADKIKEENKNATPKEITPEDKKLHEGIAQKIAEKLQKLSELSRNESFDEFYERVKLEGKALENIYQPQIKEGINLDISFKSLAKDKEDNDLDIHIKIAPNDTEKDLSINYHDKAKNKFLKLKDDALGKGGFTFEEIKEKVNELKGEVDTSIEVKRIYLKDTDHDNWEFDLKNKETGEVITIEIQRKGAKSQLPEETLERLIKRLTTDLEGDKEKTDQLDLAKVKLDKMMALTDKSQDNSKITEVGDLLTEIEGILLKLVETVTGYPEPIYKIPNGKANEVTVDKLSPNRVMGQKPSSIPLGWEHLQHKLLTTNGGSFVRMHLINMKFGGSGTKGNLVPGAEKYNSQTESQFDSKIKSKIGPQPINSAKIDPNYNNVVWIKVKVNYFGGDTFSESNKPPTIAGKETPKPNWFAQSVEFTSGDYELKNNKWDKNTAVTISDTLNMDLPQWDAAEKLSLRFANRKQIIEVAGNDTDITRLNMRILRELTFSNADELEIVIDKYIDNNDSKPLEQQLNKDELDSLFKFGRAMTSLINNQKINI